MTFPTNGGAGDASVEAGLERFGAFVAYRRMTPAAVIGYNGFSSYADVTGWRVDIYSSLAAANANLVGDIADVTVSPTSAALTAPFSGDSTSALVSLPVSIALPAAGNYYVAVLALDSAIGTSGSPSQVGVYATTGLPGSNPGDVNAYQENPGGGYNFTGNQFALNADAAYEISAAGAAPEPASLGLVGAAGGAMLVRRGAGRGRCRTS
jgi:hypothetical protein